MKKNKIGKVIKVVLNIVIMILSTYVFCLSNLDANATNKNRNIELLIEKIEIKSLGADFIIISILIVLIVFFACMLVGIIGWIIASNKMKNGLRRISIFSQWKNFIIRFISYISIRGMMFLNILFIIGLLAASDNNITNTLYGIMGSCLIIPFICNEISRQKDANKKERLIWELYDIAEKGITMFEYVFCQHNNLGALNNILVKRNQNSELKRNDNRRRISIDVSAQGVESRTVNGANPDVSLSIKARNNQNEDANIDISIDMRNNRNISSQIKEIMSNTFFYENESIGFGGEDTRKSLFMNTIEKLKVDIANCRTAYMELADEIEFEIMRGIYMSLNRPIHNFCLPVATTKNVNIEGLNDAVISDILEVLDNLYKAKQNYLDYFELRILKLRKNELDEEFKNRISAKLELRNYELSDLRNLRLQKGFINDEMLTIEIRNEIQNRNAKDKNLQKAVDMLLWLRGVEADKNKLNIRN